MSEESVATRLKVFISHLGISYSGFADNCGIPRPTLSQLVTGRNKKVSDSLLAQIHKVYPDLSIVWLLFGEGSMLLSGGSDFASPDCPELISDATNSCESASGGVLNENFASENLENVGRRTDSVEFLKENGLTATSARGQYSESKDFRLSLRVRELEAQIEKMRKNPRKVAQITVYYDDSTFETFVPKDI